MNTVTQTFKNVMTQDLTFLDMIYQDPDVSELVEIVLGPKLYELLHTSLQALYDQQEVAPIGWPALDQLMTSLDPTVSTDQVQKGMLGTVLTAQLKAEHPSLESPQELKDFEYQVTVKIRSF